MRRFTYYMAISERLVGKKKKKTRMIDLLKCEITEIVCKKKNDTRKVDLLECKKTEIVGKKRGILTY